MKKTFVIIALVLITSCVPSMNSIPSGIPTKLLPTLTPSPKPIPQFTFTPTLLSLPSATKTPYPTPDLQTWCIYDSANDVGIGYIDVVKLEAIARGPTFTAKIFVKTVPDILTFNREGVPPDTLEYSWEIWIDIDGDAETGSSDYYKFAEFNLSAMHFVLAGDETKTDSIPLGTRQTLWEHISEPDRFHMNDSAYIDIDSAAGTITLESIIPDLSKKTKIAFSTLDYNPGYEKQEDKPDSITMVPPNTECSNYP